MKPSRGWLIKAIFPNEERFELKLNKSSISWVADPAIASRDKDVMNFIFGLRRANLTSDDDLARTIKEAAENAGDLDGWFEGVRAAYAPAPWH